MRLYLDSNVLISFVRSEIDGAFNLRFVQAEDFFAACAVLGNILILSDLFFREVKKITSLEKTPIIDLFNSKGIKIQLTPNANEEKAKEISERTGIHLTDASHIATAIENDCKIIISWNKKDFDKAKTVILCFSPFEFLNNTL